MLLACMALKRHIPEWATIIWCLLAYFPVALPVWKKSWESLAEKDFFNEFTLMSIASIAAFFIGEYPEAVAVMLLYSVGEALQDKAVDNARRNIEGLVNLRSEQCTVIRNGEALSVKPESVAPGEEIEVKAGERVALDGKLLSDTALLDTAALTGESEPRSADKDDEVLAGMIVCSAPIRIKVSRPYEDSALSRILNMVQEASERKAPAELFIRRFARVYTPVVVLLAALIAFLPAAVSLIVPSFEYIFSDWIYRGLVFLVISCPCALVISVPLGYFAGIGAASRRGVLFKGGNYMDAIAKLNCVAFDKTGTLTKGKFKVVGVKCNGIPENDFLSIVLTVEELSTHPVARAVAEYVRGRGISAATLEGMQEIPGRGAQAAYGGKTVLVGNARLLNENGVSVPEAYLGGCGTIVLMAWAGSCVGMLELEDEMKEDARAAVDGLKSLGISEIILLSGDKDEVAQEYARRLGITEAHGGMLPGDKVAFVEKLSSDPSRCVAFVGDGINDAPVLTVSNVSIAMGGLGSDAAIESADVVIQTDQPSRIVDAIKIGRSTNSIVKQNIIGAISIKLIILAAGALGFASLWSAVFADVGVALLAVLNSMRVSRK